MPTREYPQQDITAPSHGVQVEYDLARGVLYIHVDGITALRICRIPKPVEFVGDCLAAKPSFIMHGSNEDCPRVVRGDWTHCHGHKILAGVLAGDEP